MPTLGCASWRRLNATPVGGHRALLSASQVACLLPQPSCLAVEGCSAESGMNRGEEIDMKKFVPLQLMTEGHTAEFLADGFLLDKLTHLLIGLNW